MKGMATPPSDETRALFKLLAVGSRHTEDGIEWQWHRYTDVHLALAATVPPGKAVRRYQERLKSSREYRGIDSDEIILGETEQIELGARALAQVTISSWKGRGVIQRGEGRDKEIKIKPGFRPPWGLGDLIPGPREPETAAAPAETAEKPEGYTDLPPSDSEPSGDAAGTAEGPSEFTAAVASAQEDTFRAAEPMPEPPADEPGEPSDAADYAWPVPEHMTIPELTECAECSLAVVSMEKHQQWHENSRAEPEAAVIPFDEGELRALIREEVGHALDNFQSGMQGWLVGQFSQLEAAVITLRSRLKGTGRWYSK